MTSSQLSTAWVAYGETGAVGSIRHTDDGFEVWMSGAQEELGVYPELEIAKRAVRSHARTGAGELRFQRR
ncbi:MAG: methyltransferase [Microbacterium sp.]